MMASRLLAISFSYADDEGPAGAVLRAVRHELVR